MGADLVEIDCCFNTETIVELEMELTDLLIFGILFVVAYVIYKILDKKMRP
jgi:hypothetical protein